MVQKKVSALILAAAVLLATVCPGVQTAYGAEQTSDRVILSQLTETSSQKQEYDPGSVITLALSVKAEDGNKLGLRGYDSTIIVDDRVFDVVKTEPLVSGMTINKDFEPVSGDNIQKLKCLYWDTASVSQANTLTLATVTLKVKNAAVGGTTTVQHTVEGVELSGGVTAVNTPANSLSFFIAYQGDAYRFRTEVAGGAAAEGYEAGDQLSVRSFLTADAASVKADYAANDLCYDASVLEVVSAEKGENVQLSQTVNGAAGRVRMIYTGGGQSAAEKTMGTVTFCVKDTLDKTQTAISQANFGVSVNGAESQRVTADSDLILTIKQPDRSAAAMMLRGKGSSAVRGEEVTAYLAVTAKDEIAPRLMQAEVIFDGAVFDFVSADAELSGTVVNNRNGRLIWVYNDSGDQPKAYQGTVTLGSITLRVKENARLGETYLNQIDGNIEMADGTLIENMTSDSLAYIVRDKGAVVYPLTVRANDPQMGTVSGGGDYEENDEAQLKAEAAPGYFFSEWQQEGGGRFTSTGSAVTRFIMPPCAATVTAIFRASETISGTVSIRGKAVPNETLTAVADQVEPEAVRAELTYQWNRNGTPITGATGETYTVKQSDLNSAISVTAAAHGSWQGSLTSAAVTIREPGSGVTVSGTVALTEGDVSRTTVILTTRKIDGAAAAYQFTPDGGDLEVGVTAVDERTGTYSFDAVSEDTYTLLIRKPGALYYQKNNLAVGKTDIDYKAVTLSVGDLNGDGVINNTDKGLVVHEDNFLKRPDEETQKPTLPSADLNNDGIINNTDKGLVVHVDNFLMRAIVE